jgi:hypothetical protein
MSSILANPLDQFAPTQQRVEILRDLPADQYHRLVYASNSRLSDLEQSPAHMRHRMLNPEPPTPALVLGTAAHDMILEKRDRVTVSGQCCAKTGKGARCSNLGSRYHAGGWWCNVKGHGPVGPGDEVGKAILTPDEYHVLQSTANAVQIHPAAAQLLDSRTETELTVIWTDPETGVRCKLRTDGIAAGVVTFDLKTCPDASPREFEKSIFNWGYHRQGAFYLDGLREVGFEVETFCVIAVEKTAPFGVCVYEIQEEALRIGREENARLLRIWAECEASDHWPCYPTTIQTIGLPRWAARQLEVA